MQVGITAPGKQCFFVVVCIYLLDIADVEVMVPHFQKFFQLAFYRKTTVHGYLDIAAEVFAMAYATIFGE